MSANKNAGQRVKLCSNDGINLTIITLLSRVMGYLRLLPDNLALPVYLSKLIYYDGEQNERLIICLICAACLQLIRLSHDEFW